MEVVLARREPIGCSELSLMTLRDLIDSRKWEGLGAATSTPPFLADWHEKLFAFSLAHIWPSHQIHCESLLIFLPYPAHRDTKGAKT